MSTPAENQARGFAPTVAKLQQTVEALAAKIDRAIVKLSAFEQDATTAPWLSPEARAALRDLVAQADKATRLQLELVRLRDAARPFGEMAQEMLNGHPTGKLPEGAPEALLAALARLDGAR